MKTAALVIAAAVLAPHLASAGTYVGLAVGPSLETSGDGSYTSTDRTGKLLVGFSFGPLAIEAAAMRGSLTREATATAYDVTQLSLAGKYSVPLAEGFEAFGRVGYQQTRLGAQNNALSVQADADGTGLLLGAGIEYRLNLVATQASLFVDYNFASATVNGPQFAAQTLQTRGFSIGATVGF